MALAFRLARAFDRREHDDHERFITRLVTPIAKFWLCKRLPMMIAECMEGEHPVAYADRHTEEGGGGAAHQLTANGRHARQDGAAPGACKQRCC